MSRPPRPQPDTLRAWQLTNTLSFRPGKPPQEQTIPYYDVLWAALPSPGDILTISIAARASAKRVKVLELAFDLGNVDAVRRATVGDWIESLLARSYGRAKRNKRAYVLINPHAGRGKAEGMWTKHARPLFRAAQMEVVEVRTTHTGHAKDLMRDLDLSRHDVVVACSGDGLPNEAFNGLALRPDAGRALATMPVCQVPCGSGNAMSCNLNGTHHPSLAALAIIKGLPTQMDLISITHGDKRELSFLSQSLGIVADLDLGTEWMRRLGELRFVLGFFWLVMKKKLYPCDLWVKVDIEKEGVKAHYRQHLTSDTSSSATSSTAAVTETDGDDSPNTQTQHAVETRPDPQASVANNNQGLPDLRFGAIMDKIPADWQCVPLEKLGNFYCGNVSVLE